MKLKLSNIKWIIGSIYLLLLIAGITFLLTNYNISDFFSYEFIRVNKNTILDLSSQIPSRKKDGIDFRNIDSYKDHLFGYDEIINCIACTNTYDENKEENWNNYKKINIIEKI